MKAYLRLAGLYIGLPLLLKLLSGVVFFFALTAIWGSGSFIVDLSRTLATLGFLLALGLLTNRPEVKPPKLPPLPRKTWILLAVASVVFAVSCNLILFWGENLFDLPSANSNGPLYSIVAAILVGPVLEEWSYRRNFFRLADAEKVRFPVLFNIVAIACIHDLTLSAASALFFVVTSFWLALSQVRLIRLTGTVVLCGIAHVAFNVVGVVFPLLNPHNHFGFIDSAVIIATFLASGFLVVALTKEKSGTTSMQGSAVLSNAEQRSDQGLL